MQSRSVEAAVDQFFGYLAGLTLGTAENHGLAATFGLQDAANNFVFIERVRAVNELLDVGLGVAFVWVVHANVNRAVLILAGQRNDSARHGCREQHGLTAVWG